LFDKQALVIKTEDCLKKLADSNMKLLFTTHGFKLLGIVSSDKMRPEEALGVRRRWVKGLAVENGTPLKHEDRIFETSLHRKNPKTGQLEDTVVHEDDLVIVMERKTFDLSDAEENFQFMPNMHMLNRVQQMSDENTEGRRRLARMEEEVEQSLLDSDHYKRQATAAVERERTQTSLINRLTRENFQLQEQIGNLESTITRLRAKNLQHEARMDERIANAQEIGTTEGMTQSDLIIHAVEKQKDINQAMMDIEPQSGGDNSIYDEMDDMKERMESLTAIVTKITGVKPEQKSSQAPASPQKTG